MIVLFIFSFLSGVITILSPCILPVLPVILAASVNASRRKTLGVVFGFILSFIFFTLSLSYLIRIFHFSSDTLRYFSAVIIGVFGIFMLFPGIFEQIANKILPRMRMQQNDRTGFVGGFLIGVGLGPLWTPCAGPILGTITTMAAMQQLGFVTFVMALLYGIGAGVPMLLIGFGSRGLQQRIKSWAKYSHAIQRIFGVLMILIAVSLFFRFDAQIKNWLYEILPQSWYDSLLNIEDNRLVKDQIDKLL